jgi:hypothetical protein
VRSHVDGGPLSGREDDRVAVAPASTKRYVRISNERAKRHDDKATCSKGLKLYSTRQERVKLG